MLVPQKDMLELYLGHQCCKLVLYSGIRLYGRDLASKSSAFYSLNAIFFKLLHFDFIGVICYGAPKTARRILFCKE